MDCICIYVKHELQFLHFNSHLLCRHHPLLLKVRVTQDEDLLRHNNNNEVIRLVPNLCSLRLHSAPLPYLTSYTYLHLQPSDFLDLWIDDRLLRLSCQTLVMSVVW